MCSAINATTCPVVATRFYIAAGQVINPYDRSLLSVAVGCVINVIDDIDRSRITTPENPKTR